MAFVDATIVNIAIPNIHADFRGSSLSSVSWVLNAYNIIFAAFLVGGGQLADLLGRRRIFGLALIVFTVASAACAAAPTLGLLVAARLLQAAGAAALVPSSLAIVLEAHPGGRRTHAVSLWAAIAALAAGIGPGLGGVLITASSWRLVFLVNIPIGIAAYVLAGRVLVESRAPGRRRVPDLVGAVVLALSIALLVLGIVKGQEWGWGNGRTIGAVAGAVLLGIYFVLRSSRQRVPVVDLALMRIRAFSLSNGVTVVMAGGFYGYTLCNVLFLTTIWKYSILKAGLSLTPGPLVAIAVAAPASRAVGRWGHRAVAVPGALIWAVGVAFFATQLGLSPDFIGSWLPGMVILGVGAGLTFPTLSGAAVESVPGPRFAVATSLNAVARQIGAALGVAVLIAIVGNGSAPRVPVGLPAGLLAAIEHSALERALTRFQGGWFFACGCFVFGALACLALRVTASSAPEAEQPGVGLGAVPAPVDVPGAAELPSLADSDGVRAVVEPEPVAEFLRNAPVFADLPGTILDRVASLVGGVTLQRGEWLFREGEPADAVYLVRVGHLEVLREIDSDTNSHEAMNTLTRGAVLGELALLSSSTRSASVRALRDTELLRIDKSDFAELLRSEPDLALSLTSVLSSQLQASRAIPAARRAKPVTIALRAAGLGVPLLDIADELSRSLCERGKVAVLHPGEGDESTAAAGSRAEAAARYGPVVESCELEHDHVIMVCGASEHTTGWDEFCISRADRVLAIVSGAPVDEGDAAGGHGVWATGLRGADLVGFAISEGAGDLKGWIELLHPSSIHVLRAGPDMRGDIQRMSRRLSGEALGVVLSGGGARAFAHLGALEVLIAAGMPLDRVGGVSMGAFIGAQLAMGREVAEIDACCYEEWVRNNPINDYTIPRHGLIRGHKARAMLERVFGDARTEELPRSFYCASVNLRQSRLVLNREGPLVDSVGASMSLPLIAPPLRHGDALLIDGSLLDNLPLQPMAASGEGPVLAMDIKAGAERPARSDTATRAAATRRLPSLPETLGRIALLSSANTDEAAQRYADMTISMRVSGVGLLEFHQIDQAREAGRRAATEALAGDAPRWLTSGTPPAADLTGRRTVVRV